MPPNKVSFPHYHWTVKKILPLRHIPVWGLTALLRRTWNYSRHLAEQQVTAHSHHRYGRPCPHALENGALESLQPFKASSSSPDEQHPPPLHSGLHIFARNIHWHLFQPEMPWPMRLLTVVLLFWYTLCLPMEACRQQKKTTTKKLTKTAESLRKGHVMSKNKWTGQIYWETEKSAFNHNSLQSLACVLI